ncbi:MAG TPA: hypothetical protein VGE36_00915 [Roseateles sp.]
MNSSSRRACYPNANNLLNSCGLWLDGEQVTKPLKFATDDWQQFIDALLTFAAAAPKEKS